MSPNPMQLTYLDSNTWQFNLNGFHVLLDPWLVGSLTFGGQAWFFEGKRPRDRVIPTQIDLILLSQGLPDHAHPPTLKQLDRQIPVVASPSAAKVVEALGYQQVTVLKHGETTSIQGIQIQAIPGSPIGPTTVENAYLVRSQAGSFYYEPHGYHHQPSLRQADPVDAVIVPTQSLKLPVVGAFIQGNTAAIEVAAQLKARFIIPTAVGGDVEFSGVLNQFLSLDGSVTEFTEQLNQQCPTTTLITPQPGIPFEISPA